MLKRIGLVLVLLTALPIWLAAQGSDETVAITFPPPVYVMGGEAEIVGSANPPGFESYFIEYQPLSETLEPRDGEDTAWLPATLPSRTPVTDGLLGLWDTTAAPDGLYALRLTVNVDSGSPIRSAVTPIRIVNEIEDPFAPLDEDDAINNALLALTATASARDGGGDSVAVATIPPSTRGTLVPTPASGTTTFGSGTLIGTTTAQVTVVANLRAGDSTLFSIRGALAPGDTLDVIGRSNRGNNWLLVETEDGERGWVAPSVVRLEGSILDVGPVDPPTIPVTPTPVATPVPQLADATITRVAVDRDLVEGQNFQIIVEYRNDGALPFGDVLMFCNVEPMDVEVAWTVSGLASGASGSGVIPLRLDEGGGGEITIICRIDMAEEVTEISESNNTGVLGTFLTDN